MKPAISDLPQNSKEGTPSMDGSPLSVSKGDIPGGQTDIVRMRSEVPGVITRRRGCVPLRVRIYSSSDVECDLNPSRYSDGCLISPSPLSPSVRRSLDEFPLGRPGSIRRLQRTLSEDSSVGGRVSPAPLSVSLPI